MAIPKSEGCKVLPLGRVWWGYTVMETGRPCQLKVGEPIPLLPSAQFIPLPAGIEIIGRDGLKKVPKGEFFLSFGTKGPHIVVEVAGLPMAPLDWSQKGS